MSELATPTEQTTHHEHGIRLNLCRITARHVHKGRTPSKTQQDGEKRQTVRLRSLELYQHPHHVLAHKRRKNVRQKRRFRESDRL